MKYVSPVLKVLQLTGGAGPVSGGPAGLGNPDGCQSQGENIPV